MSEAHIPTSVSLEHRIKAEKDRRKKRQQRQRPRFHQRPASAHATLMRTRRRQREVYDEDLAEKERESEGPTPSSMKPTISRPRKKRTARKGRDGHMPYSKENTVLDGAEGRRVTKAKYMKSYAHVYLYDDWMQTFVLPSAYGIQ